MAGITAADLTVCQDTLIHLTANVVGGGMPYTYSWREDGVPVGTNSSTLEIPGGSAGVHNYSVSVSDICGSPVATNNLDVTVIARPNVAVTSSNDICETGSAELTATGATSYTWEPENGTLSAYTGSTVTSAPTFTTAYNVIGVSSVTGCASTVPITQFVHLLPVADPTATPNPILLNANTQLNAQASQNSNYGYTVSPVAYGSRYLGPLLNSGDALFDEGNIDVTLGFNFNYYGSNYSGVTIHANGQVLMGTGNSSADFNYSPPFSGIPTSDEPNNWVGYWTDMYVSSDGQVTYGVIGSAPNRKLVVRFDEVDYYFSTPSNTFQIELHESSNEIQFFMTDNAGSAFHDRQIGIEDASGALGIAAPNRNVGTWTASNEGWKFAPISFGAPVFTYSWSPDTYLDNTTIENPFATSVGGVTTYTVNVTNTTTGCDAAPATIQVLAGVPLTITASSLVNTICAGTSATLVATAGGGGVPYSFEWFIGNTSVGTGATFIVAPEATTTYTVKVTDVGNNTLESAPFTINVIPLPDVFVTPPGGSICNSNTGIALTASGNSSSYSWSGNGLSSTVGSVVVANPPFTSLVTVTGTRVSGGIPCQNSATVTVHKAQLGANATASPPNICNGESSNLNVTGANFLESYMVASLPFSNMDNSPLANAGPQGDEGNVLANLGFSFRFFGNTYTQVTIHANGQILMGNNNSADFQYSPFGAFPSPFGPNNWVGYWADMDAYQSPETPDITWDVVGSAPNRKFIARWDNVDYYFETPALSYQIELNETSDLIDVFIVDNSTSNTFSSRMIGIENANGTVGTTPPGRGIGTWETSNEGWRFTPPLGTFNYSWSPTTFLTNSAIQNPVAQAVNATIIYTATATDPVSGCSITDTTRVRIVPEPRLDITGPANACVGLSTNLTFNFTGFPPFNYTYTDGISTFGPFVAASNSVSVAVTPPGIAGEFFTYSPLTVSDAYCEGTGGGSHTVLVVPMADLTGVTLTSNKPLNLVCSGDNITLSLNGIVNSTIGYQGQWKWYRGGCSTSGGGVLIASGVDNVKVSPTVNTTYYVRSEGTCGNSSCLSIAVLVSTSGLNGTPNILYSPPIAYAGLTDSLVVAPIVGAYYYRWTNGGNSQVLFDGHPAPYITTSNKVMITFVSGATQGNGIGNYHLSFFAANGCGRSNHSNIQIRSSVAAPAVINGPNVACPGQTRTYSIPAITGAKSYEWDLTSGNGTITGNGTTTVTVNFTSLPATLCVHGVSAFNSDGPDLCLDITTTILAPASVSGDTLPCPSSTSTYIVDSVVGAISYNWSTTVPGGSVAGTGLSAIATFPAGSFSGAICVRANSGCTLSPMTCRTLVNGAPAPVGTITGPVNGLCAVTSVNFQVPSTGATLYNWVAPAGANITSGQGTNSILVDFASGFPGGSISVTANNACGTTNGSLPVSGATLPPTITPSASAACSGESVGYTAAASGATSYAWTVDPDEGTIATISGNGDMIIVDWETNGGQVSAVATNSCGTSAPAFLITPSGSCRVSGNAVLANVLRASVFPNPTQGQLTLQYNSPEKADYLLKVTDLAGRLIVNNSLSGMQGLNRHELDLSALAKGMYKLSLENASGESIVIKVVID